jgi:hypothetical protein
MDEKTEIAEAFRDYHLYAYYSPTFEGDSSFSLFAPKTPLSASESVPFFSKIATKGRLYAIGPRCLDLGGRASDTLPQFRLTGRHFVSYGPADIQRALKALALS